MCGAFARHDAGLVFGVVRPVWLAQTPAWFGKRFLGNFALLDYGSHPFVVTDDDHPFYGVNYGVRTEVRRSLGGGREDLGPVSQAGGGEDTDLFVRARAHDVSMVCDPSAVVGHMIEPWRCTKAFQRRRAWLGSKPFFHTLLTDQPSVPRILHVPRHLYRRAADHVGGYAKGVLQRDRIERFYRELKLIQFAGLVSHGVRHLLRPVGSASSSRG